MASKPTTSKRKQPVSQKRVALVLAVLVATLTLSAGLLLALERLPVNGQSPTAFALDISAVTNVKLRPEPWRFIIVYESGDSAASAADLADGRNAGGTSDNAARPGANFHFVVDSARGADGDLVRGSAWPLQQDGAPNVIWPDARSYSSPYTNAVGICLVGDVNTASRRQTDQLTALVKDLREKLNIPPEQVLFQWELKDPSKTTAAQKSYADSLRRGL